MYQTILVTLDATDADRTILEHVRPLAKSFHSRLILLHVADGWTARTYGEKGVSREIDEDRVALPELGFEQLRGERLPAALCLGFARDRLRGRKFLTDEVPAADENQPERDHN